MFLTVNTSSTQREFQMQTLNKKARAWTIKKYEIEYRQESKLKNLSIFLFFSCPRESSNRFFKSNTFLPVDNFRVFVRETNVAGTWRWKQLQSKIVMMKKQWHVPEASELHNSKKDPKWSCFNQFFLHEWEVYDWDVNWWNQVDIQGRTKCMIVERKIIEMALIVRIEPKWLWCSPRNKSIFNWIIFWEVWYAPGKLFWKIKIIVTENDLDHPDEPLLVQLLVSFGIWRPSWEDHKNGFFNQICLFICTIIEWRHVWGNRRCNDGEVFVPKTMYNKIQTYRHIRTICIPTQSEGEIIFRSSTPLQVRSHRETTWWSKWSVRLQVKIYRTWRWSRIISPFTILWNFSNPNQVFSRKLSQLSRHPQKKNFFIETLMAKLEALFREI